MKPIKYELRKDKKLYSKENEIIDGYKRSERYSFTPEVLEDAGMLTQNHILEKYLKQKENYTYIGTIEMKHQTHNYYVEYYYTENGIIAFLIYEPKGKYYPSLDTILIYERKGDVC